jgi:phosphoglycerate kinase
MGADQGRSFDVPFLEDLPDPAGKRVLVRANFDFPVNQSQPIWRSRQLLQLAPTIQWLANRGAKVTICGHQQTFNSPNESDRYGRTADAVNRLYPEVAVAPNLGIEGAHSDQSRLEMLVDGQDLFVNDDFQWCSLPLASVIGPPTMLPSAAGRRLQADLEILAPFCFAPERPLVVVLGSRDVLDRLHDLQALVLRADAILVGGQMSYPFLEVLDKQPPGDEPRAFIEECRHAYGIASAIRHDIQLPTDLVWEAPDGEVTISGREGMSGGSIRDIGPKTRARYGEILRGAGSILWAGSLGEVEEPRFAEGTLALGRALSIQPVRTVLGGDALLNLLTTHCLLPDAAGIVSATGSAVALLKEGDLPGLAALRRSPVRSGPSC